MRRTISIIFLLLISTFSFTFSQVVIKEKVNLNPNGANITNTNTGNINYYLPCGPLPDNPVQYSNSYIEYWRVTWYGSVKGIGINQSFMPCEPTWPPDNQTWNVDIIEGTQYIRIRKYGESSDAGFHLTGLTWADQNQYSIYFDQLEPVDSAFVVCRVYCPQTGCVSVFGYIEVSPHFTLEVGSSSRELYHGDEVKLYADALNQCGNSSPPLPDNIKYNAEIVQGNEYGELKDYNTGITGDTLIGLQHWDGFLNLLSFLADKISPINRDSVIIRFSTTNQNIEPVIITLYLNPSPLKVTIFPEVISPGDTAEIIIKKRNPDGSLEDYPPSQAFEVGMIEGCEGGTLLAEGDTGAYLYNVYQPIKFIAADNIQGDTLSIKLRAALVEGGIIAARIAPADSGRKLGIVNKIVQTYGKKNLNYPKSEAVRFNKVNTVMKKVVQSYSKEEQVQNSLCFSGEFQNPNSEDTTMQIVDYKILLGETKYYQAKYNSQQHKLNIEEIKPDANGVPKQKTGTENGWQWLTDNAVWGSNPVSVDTGKNYGKRMGVYWETEKPVWDGNTNKGNLDKGLIRLVGRYWIKDSAYVVTLKAKRNNGDSTSIRIKVIIPIKLLTNGQTPTYARTKDVHDSVVNIDSLCIYYAGVSGIPPQFYKGHIFQESAKDYYAFTDGKTERCFAPSYRYEPYTTQIKKSILIDRKENPFFITASTIVSPPSDHQHVKILPYFSGDTITVWQIVKEHSQLVEDGSTDETKMYGVRTYADTMNYNAYPTIRKTYRTFFDELDDKEISNGVGSKRLMTLAEKADSANKLMILYLRDEYTDAEGTKGMKNMIAQTRIASSYGYFQALYTTAAGWGYEEDTVHLPENLNTFKVLFPYTVKAYKKYLARGLTNEGENNWSEGFETTIKENIFPQWNTRPGYPDETLNNIKKFLPQNK